LPLTKRTVAVLVPLLLAIPVQSIFATEPPPATTETPRLHLNIPKVVLPPQVAPRVPLTVDAVRHLALSPLIANALIAHLNGQQSTVAAASTQQTNQDPALSVRRATRIRPLTSQNAQQPQGPAYPVNSVQETEPVLRTININGIEQTVTAFQRFDSPNYGHAEIYVQQRNGGPFTMLPRKYNDISGEVSPNSCPRVMFKTAVPDFVG